MKVTAFIENVKDALAFQFLGWRGALGRWAINRVVDVWCRTPSEDPW